MSSTGAWRLAAGLTVGCVAAFLLALGLTSVAASDKQAVRDVSKTNVNITKIEPEKVAGNVKSPNDACLKGRKVELFYAPHGVDPSQEQKLGQDKTNKAGKWAIPGDYFVGQYHATTRQKSFGRANEKGKLEEHIEEVEEELRRHPTCDSGSSTSDE